MRLFPVNKSFQFIYDEYFIPWFDKLARQMLQQTASTSLPSDEGMWTPSLTLFKKSRYHPDFNDVKKRPKHYHARCRDCDELNTLRLRGFVNNEQKVAYQIAFAAHEAEARSWHEHEETVKAVSRRNPSQTMVLGYDDTSDLQLPKFTNRDIKNLTKTRLHVIPFNITNYTSGETAYVYTLKNRYPKGANRLCTVLYHYLRKVKYGDHPCKYARKLYLHADNYSENKNNVVIMFCCELVSRGWFDEIYMEFGPPGHTHNGTDAVHRIHNRVAGNFTSLTLGDFQRCWKHSWRKSYTMPDAVLNDAHLDWVSRYQGSQNRIAGFTTTTHDHRSVSAFLIHNSPRGAGWLY